MNDEFDKNQAVASLEAVTECTEAIKKKVALDWVVRKADLLEEAAISLRNFLKYRDTPVPFALVNLQGNDEGVQSLEDQISFHKHSVISGLDDAISQARQVLQYAQTMKGAIQRAKYYLVPETED